MSDGEARYCYLVAFGTTDPEPDEIYERVRRLLESSVELIASSRLYETEAVGEVSVRFANAAIWLASDLPPGGLLRESQHVERQCGRTAESRRWRLRSADLDLIACLDQGSPVEMNGITLRLPHPLAHFRRFVLDPAVSIAPAVPIGPRTVADWVNHWSRRPLPVWSLPSQSRWRDDSHIADAKSPEGAFDASASAEWRPYVPLNGTAAVDAMLTGLLDTPQPL